MDGVAAGIEAPTGDFRAAGVEALKGVLEGHRRWVETEGSEGVRADLTRMDLTRANLEGANLQGAILTRARLRGADLSGANLVEAELDGAYLKDADLSKADLRRANVRQAILRDAVLSDVDLTGVRGLLPGQLGGANLAACRLPDDVAKFDGLANVAEASKTTQGLFFSMLFVCAYAWLTIASTRDAQLLNNASPPSSRLPILGIDIPLVQFYMAAPLLLLCLFIYFQFCLQRLWEELGELPAIFPDGRPLDKRAYPWLLNGVVRMHAPRLKEACSPLTLWQARISVLLAWGMVPLTIGVLWARYLRSHDWWVTMLHVGVLAISIGVGLGFRRLAGATLRGSERAKARRTQAWGDARVWTLATSGLTAAALVLLSFGAIEGVNPSIESRGVTVEPVGWARKLDPRQWVPWAFQAVGFNTFAQLDDSTLSVKPGSWSGGAVAAELDAVRGADLEKRNLRYGMAYNAFLVNAYARHADLQGADLRVADLRRADLREALLQGTNLRGAKLEKADLRWANLSGAKLTEATLKEAKLEGAILPDAKLIQTDLTGADLTEADLRGADLREAILDQANLFGADLRQTKGLSATQLKVAQINEETKLPEELKYLARVTTAAETMTRD